MYGKILQAKGTLPAGFMHFIVNLAIYITYILTICQALYAFHVQPQISKPLRLGQSDIFSKWTKANLFYLQAIKVFFKNFKMVACVNFMSK